MRGVNGYGWFHTKSAMNEETVHLRVKQDLEGSLKIIMCHASHGDTDVFLSQDWICWKLFFFQWVWLSVKVAVGHTGQWGHYCIFKPKFEIPAGLKIVIEWVLLDPYQICYTLCYSSHTGLTWPWRALKINMGYTRQGVSACVFEPRFNSMQNCDLVIMTGSIADHIWIST